MVFHDRRLQYTEHQQLEGWKWNRPGDRLLDIGNDEEILHTRKCLNASSNVLILNFLGISIFCHSRSCMHI